MCDMSENIRTKGLEIVDNDGRVVVQIGTRDNGRPFFSLLNGEGVESATLEMDDSQYDGVTLTLRTTNDMELALGVDSGAGCVTISRNGHVITGLGGTKEGEGGPIPREPLKCPETDRREE